MKRLFAAIFKIPLVWTRDFDGEIRLRLARSSPFGGYTAKGVLWTRGILQPDGTITKGAYLREWTAANKYAERLFQ